MANPEHLAILKQGVKVWNEWRKKHPRIQPDLIEAQLSNSRLNGINLSKAKLNKADLREAHLHKANLSKADLNKATLYRATLSGANLSEAILYQAILSEANLSEATLTKATLFQAHLTRTNLTGANLGEANLFMAILTQANLVDANLSNADITRTQLVETDLRRTNLTNCSVYGISAWDVKLERAIQSNLIITRDDQPTIKVDNLEVAQFIYLLLNNEKIRGVIDTIARKVILILGRFTPERKNVLDAIREELRKRDYLPVLFDFDKSATRDLTETIRTLAHLSRFIIADLTDPSSIPQELYAIVPTLAVAVQPLLESGKREYSMFVDLRTTYHWVLPIHEYKDTNDLLASLGDKVIAPAEQKAKELEKR